MIGLVDVVGDRATTAVEITFLAVHVGDLHGSTGCMLRLEVRRLDGTREIVLVLRREGPSEGRCSGGMPSTED